MCCHDYEQPSGLYPDWKGIKVVWLQVKKQWRRQNRQRAERDKEDWDVCVCVCVCVSLFVFCRVKVLISLAGTVPTTLICQAALSPGEGKVNVWEEALRGWKRVNWCLEWHQGSDMWPLTCTADKHPYNRQQQSVDACCIWYICVNSISDWIYRLVEEPLGSASRQLTQWLPKWGAQPSSRPHFLDYNTHVFQPLAGFAIYTYVWLIYWNI